MRITLVLFLGLILSTAAAAGDKAGEISKLEGKVLVYRGGGVRGEAVEQPGTSVGVGDAVTTKREALAYLSLIDGNRVILKENSTLNIKGVRTGDVGGGTVLFDVRKRGDLKGFEVTTGTITMGVRGTRFAVENRDGRIAIHLKEGRLHVDSETGPLQRRRPDDLEGFRELQAELKVQAEAAQERLRRQFEEAKQHMQAGDLEFVESIDLEGGSSLVIEGNEVWQSALPAWAEEDFALFDQFPATEP